MNSIIHGDCRQILVGMPPGWADLVIADPPFNIGFKYDQYKDRLPPEEYVQWTQTWIGAVDRAAHPTASIWLVISDEYAAQLKTIAARRWKMRNWIIWKYAFGQNCSNKFNRCKTHLLYFVKDENQFAFNRGPVMVRSDRQTIYNDSRAAAGGKIMDDVWTDIPRLCGTFRERQGWHGCQLPEALIQRIMLTSSHVGNQVLDPFCGSGTSAAVAKRLQRACVTTDVSAAYVRDAKKRVAEVEPGFMPEVG